LENEIHLKPKEKH